MTQQIMIAVALVMTMMLTACGGNTSVTNYGGVRGNGYFQGGGMGSVEAGQY